MSAEPWVCIIVVNYNSGNLLQVCVNALARQTMPDFEVIIFDNHSTDGSIVDLVLPDGRFRVQHASVNLGFAAANNRAIYACSAHWIIALNPDVRPSQHWLRELRSATERYPWAHAFGSTQLQTENPRVVDGFGDVLSVWGFAWRGLGGYPARALPRDDREVFAPCGAAALY